MRICLVTAPTEQRPSRNPLADAPLGALTLAAVLLNHGIPVDLVDLDSLGAAHTLNADQIADSLAERACPVYGFGSICSSYPFTLRVARGLKQLLPDVFILLGGPQATATDMATLQAFGFIDAVVRGEADASLPRVLEALERGDGLERIAGVTFRRGGQVMRTANPPPVLDLDALPLPAYHLLPGAGLSPVAALEAGRGCPFACTFCSTNDFFRRKFRLKSPAALIAQMRMLEARYGSRTFDLVHDMFTVDRRAVTAFCDAMQASSAGYQWLCSARTDCIDRDLIDRMAAAGCVGLFFGIESGSARMQKIIGKNLDLRQAREMIDHACALGIRVTASHITGFPEETAADVRDTCSFLAGVARHENAIVQVHLLAPLAGTPVLEQYGGALRLPAMASDISGGALNVTDREMVSRFPEVFPNFYALPALHLERAEIEAFAAWAQQMLDNMRWLFLAIERECGGAFAVFRAWRASVYSQGTAAGLLDFLEAACAEDASRVLSARLIFLYREMLYREMEKSPAETVNGMQIASHAATLDHAFVLPPGLRCLYLPFRLVPVLQALRIGSAYVPDPTPSVVLSRSGEAAQLQEVSGVSAQLLTMADGTRLVREAAALGDWSETRFGPFPREAVVLGWMRELERHGMIQFCAPVVEQELSNS